MALINCSECGKEVSSKAQSCPQCGNPISLAPKKDAGICDETITTIQQTSQPLKIQSLAALSLVIFSIFVAFESFNRSGKINELWLWLIIAGSIWYIVAKFQVWFYHD